MRIGIDAREWRSDTSTGIARILTTFVTWASHTSDHEFVLFGNQNTEARVDGQRIALRIAAETRTLAWDQYVLPRLLAEESVDVFLSPYYKAPLAAGCPRIVTVNDLIDLRFPPHGWRRRRRLLRPWMRLVLRRADAIMTISEFSRRDIGSTFGIPAERIHVVPAAVDDRFLAPPRDELVDEVVRRLNLPRRYVLYVGRCAPHKNVATLVEAWSSLPIELREDHPLVLAGAEADQFRSVARGFGADSVTPGFIDDRDLPGLYGGAAVLGFPSLYEGFGLPPLEAMGCATPVISSDATAMPEVLGDAALYASPDDIDQWTGALREVLTNDDLRSTLIERGRARAAGFTSERTAAAILSVIERVHAGQSP